MEYTITTTGGHEIPMLEKNPADFVDKTTLILGASNTGKSRLIYDVLYTCRNEIPNVIVICPGSSAKDYLSFLPKKCVKEELKKINIERIWKRQTDVTQLYNIANDENILRSLFEKVPDRNAAQTVRTFNNKTEEIIERIKSDPELDSAKKVDAINSVNEKKQVTIKNIYRDTIMRYKEFFSNIQLTDEERYCLEYQGINPKLMIVIDDCTDQLRNWHKLFNKEKQNLYEAIFYRGRHNHISIIMAAHDDKYIATELRKNIRVTIFTTFQAANTYFSKSSAGFPKNEKIKIEEMCREIFAEAKNGNKNYKKFCYIRDGIIPYKYTIATIRSLNELEVGSRLLSKLAQELPDRDSNSIHNNQFIEHKKTSAVAKSRPVF